MAHDNSCGGDWTIRICNGPAPQLGGLPAPSFGTAMAVGRKLQLNPMTGTLDYWEPEDS